MPQLNNGDWPGIYYTEKEIKKAKEQMLEQVRNGIVLGQPPYPMISAHGDVILSKLLKVPKIRSRKLKVLLQNGQISPFTSEVLKFVLRFRGTNVFNFLSLLQEHMLKQISGFEYGVPRLVKKNGYFYNPNSIHTLVKKALIYTELYTKPI